MGRDRELEELCAWVDHPQRRLSTFRGSFELDGTRTVAGVEPPVVLALANKSLLRRTGPGRFAFHPMIAAFAAERASDEPAERSAVERAHAVHFLASVEAHRGAYRANDAGHRLHEIDLEIDDVAAARTWAVGERQEGLLAEALEGLGQYLWSRNRFDLRDRLLGCAGASAAPGGLLQGRLLMHHTVSDVFGGRASRGRPLHLVALRPDPPGRAGPGQVRGAHAVEETLARVALARGAVDVAERWLHVAPDPEDGRWWVGPRELTAALVRRAAVTAEVVAALGDLRGAAGTLVEPLERAAHTGVVAVGLEALVSAGIVLSRTGDESTARRLWSVVARAPEAPFEARRRAIAFLASPDQPGVGPPPEHRQRPAAEALWQAASALAEARSARTDTAFDRIARGAP